MKMMWLRWPRVLERLIGVFQRKIGKNALPCDAIWNLKLDQIQWNTLNWSIAKIQFAVQSASNPLLFSGWAISVSNWWVSCQNFHHYNFVTQLNFIYRRESLHTNPPKYGISGWYRLRCNWLTGFTIDSVSNKRSMYGARLFVIQYSLKSLVLIFLKFRKLMKKTMRTMGTMKMIWLSWQRAVLRHNGCFQITVEYALLEIAVNAFVLNCMALLIIRNCMRSDRFVAQVKLSI